MFTSLYFIASCVFNAILFPQLLLLDLLCICASIMVRTVRSPADMRSIRVRRLTPNMKKICEARRILTLIWSRTILLDFF